MAANPRVESCHLTGVLEYVVSLGRQYEGSQP
jgi:hypothetical protein